MVRKTVVAICLTMASASSSRIRSASSIAAAVDRLDRGELDPRVGRQPLAQPFEMVVELRARLALGGDERLGHADHHHDRNADHPAVGDQETPERHRPQGRMDLLGELDHPGRLVDDHHHEAEHDQTACQHRQGLERLLHRRRSRCRSARDLKTNARRSPLLILRSFPRVQNIRTESQKNVDAAVPVEDRAAG